MEETVKGYYEVIEAGEFERAYSYFDPTYRGTIDRGSWINDKEYYYVWGATVDSLEVPKVSGPTSGPGATRSTSNHFALGFRGPPTVGGPLNLGRLK